MAESVAKDFKGKMDWVYVGKAEAPKIVEKKADTLWNEYMRGVLDVSLPVAVAEKAEAAATQGALAGATAEFIAGDALPKDGNTIPDKDAFLKKWIELDKKFSTPEQQNRLGKILTGLVSMAGSLGVNMGSEYLADMLYRERKTIPIPKFPIDISKETGNQRMLDAGWEYLTDFGIEKIADRQAKNFANREDVGFVSPLSRLIGKVGNTIMNATRDFDNHDAATKWKRSVLNPGFIEGAFRFASAMPLAGGFIKEAYGYANKQIMHGEGIIPLSADLTFNMLFAKVMYRLQHSKAEKT